MAMFLTIGELDMQGRDDGFATTVSKQLCRAIGRKQPPEDGIDGLYSLCEEEMKKLGGIRVGTLKMEKPLSWNILMTKKIPREVISALDCLDAESSTLFNGCVLVILFRRDATPPLVVTWEGVSLPMATDTDWELRRCLGDRVMFISTWKNFLDRISRQVRGEA